MIEPTPRQLQQFQADPGTGPVTMLNLLRFAGEAGRASYARYSGEVIAHLQRVGGEIVYYGDCDDALIGPDEREWDAVALVRYPSRAAFLEMVTHPEYLATAEHRSAGLADSRLIPSP